MNKVILMGRLTRDPEIRYTQGEKSTCIASFSLAVDRRYKGEQTADFINCVAFGKVGEHVEKYYHKGMKTCLSGRLQTRNYNRDGQKVYVTEVVVEEMHFAESKGASGQKSESKNYAQPTTSGDPLDGFMGVPDGIDDVELPFT